jgi:hypothetical protein
MDASEPEQKRIKRITEYIEDEIVRSQHLPLEELIQHKAAMIHVLQFLNIEEAYAVSLASRRIYEWFQKNDIWYALAQRWLTPEQLAEYEALVEKVRRKWKRVNYLWVLLWEFMICLSTKPTIRIVSHRTGRQLVDVTKYAPDTITWEDNIAGVIIRGLNDTPALLSFYEVMNNRLDARVKFSAKGPLIRSKLAN